MNTGYHNTNSECGFVLLVFRNKGGLAVRKKPTTFAEEIFDTGSVVGRNRKVIFGEVNVNLSKWHCLLRMAI